MKKIPFYLAASISLFFILLFSGCKKNIQDAPYHPENIENGLSVTEARKWYEQTPRISLRTTTNNKANFNIRTPNWEKTIQSQDSNYYVIELPVLFEKTPGFTFTNLNEKSNPEKANDAAKLLILKNKNTGTMRSALMHIVSDNGNSDNISSYGKINKNFSGFVFFTNLDGTFINGYKYEKGKITGKTSKRRLDIKKTSKRIGLTGAVSLEAPPDPGICTTVTVTLYVRTCTYYPNGEVNCTAWKEEDSWNETSCTGGSGGGGTGGGNSYIQNDQPATPQQNVDKQWVSKIKDSTNDPCDARVLSILKNLATNTLPDLFRNVFDSLGDVNITIKSANLGNKEGGHTDQNYTTNNYAITLNSYWQNASTLSKAATILHEMVHAQLMNWYRQAVNENDYSKKQYLVSNYYLFFDAADIANYPDQAFITLMNDNQPGQHQIMTFGNFRDAVSNTLFQFAKTIDANTTVTKLYTDDLAWTGTYDAKGFTTLPLAEQERLRGIIEGERGNTTESYNQKGKPCDTQISVE